jgi:D-serine deaminase-like pyridoxal phosphate-dependent protein
MISFLDKTWTDVYKPTLILRAEVAKANIAWMADKANKAGVRFRPHFKTHQSAHVGQWYKEAGVTAITVSSVTMVQYFARAGWNDITIAFPVNIREVAAINELASKVSLNLVVESLETVSFLAKALTHAVKVWIKTDTGYKRTGIDWQNIRGVVDLAKSIKQHDTLHFAGLLAHAGHSYKEYTLDRILDIHQQTLSRLQELKSELEQAHFNDCELSLGDTPSCSLADDFTGVNEIRPGNFVFYDVQQLTIGSCHEKDLALAVACPVAAKHPERGTVIIYGGAVHFSKDFAEANGTKKYGLVVGGDNDKWAFDKDAYLSAVSQEHGTVKLPADVLEQVNVGDLLLIVPAHACLAVDLIRDYRTFQGEKFRAWS